MKRRKYRTNNTRRIIRRTRPPTRRDVTCRRQLCHIHRTDTSSMPRHQSAVTMTLGTVYAVVGAVMPQCIIGT